MTSLRSNQFKAPDCGQSTRFKLAQVTVDSRLVQHFHHLLMQLSIAPSWLSFYGMKQVTVLRIDSVSAWTASPTTLSPSHISTPRCIKLVVGSDLLYNRAWKGILRILDFSGKSKITWQDSGFDCSLTTRLTILRSSSAASRSAPAKTKTKFVPSPTLQKT